jgi:Type III restriction enzyme, res subunit
MAPGCDQPLTRRELGTFTSLAFNTCRHIARAVVAHTCTRPVSKRHLMRDTFEIGLDRWQSLDWTLIVRELRGKSTRPQPRHPRPHQARAISAAKAHFIRDKAARGRLIMPCATGKSLAAFWIAEALKAKTILVAVPSLALIRQSVTDWTREFLAHGQVPDWVCVCSDETVGKNEADPHWVVPGCEDDWNRCGRRFGGARADMVPPVAANRSAIIAGNRST